MAEERTAEEREAARLERERRRAAKAGVELPQAVPSAPAPPPPEPEPEPMAPPEPGPEPVASPEPELEPIAPPEPEAITPPEPDPEPEPIASPEPEPDPEPDPEAIAPPEPEPEPEPIAPKPRARVVRSRAPRRPRRPRRPPREPGRHSRRTRIAAAIALVLAAAVVWFCVELFQPFHGSGSGSVIVTIPAHSSASRVGGLLARDGVISSSFFFQLRATLGGERDDLRAGTYRLKHGMSYGTALSVLTNPPPAAKVTEVTIVPGHTRAQVNALLHAQGIAGSYLSATRSSPLLNPRSYGAPAGTASLEGFLFPDTYQVRLPISIPALVADQLTTFKQQFASVNLSYARHKNLTPYDVLIIASMIEGEASTAQDRTLVASVIYNRLRDNMPLQLDDTTRYATGNYTTPLTQAQVNSSSPYNTRIHMGLTPTPIDSPSLASIQAATHPANTNYLYFVVEPCGNGAMVFSANYAQFLRDQQRYNSARAAQGGRSPEKCS